MRGQGLLTADVNARLNQHSPLDIWHAGLIHGSLIYFEMKDKIPELDVRGANNFVGSAYMSIGADDWVIERGGTYVIDSKHVTRAVFEGLVAPMFLGKVLSDVGWNRTQKSIFINITDGIVINIRYDLFDDIDNDYFLTIHLPNGDILYFCVDDGFYLSDEQDTTLALYWQTGKTV